MERRIYLIILIISVIIGVYVYVFIPNNFSAKFLLIFAFLPFLMFATGVHGLAAHLLKLSVKGGLIGYPIIMGVVFCFLLLIHIFVILPLVCPSFQAFVK